jgi:hypothetical protein
MSTVMRFPFNEPEGVLPSDATGNLNDLRAEAGITAPTRVSMWTGFGRRFRQADTNALFAGDASELGTMLLRNVTVRALLSLTLTGAAGPQVILSRGTNDGALADRYCYGLELEEQAGNPGFVEVRMFWHDSTGALKKQPAGVFKHAGDGEEFKLTATRRWEATDRVVCRYYIGDDMIAELVTADGDIAGGTTGKTSIGAKKSAGVWSSFFNGDIDELEVLAKELSPEEIREDWKRLTVYQPAGVVMFKGLAPRGIFWTLNDGNDIGKLVKIAGQALGFGMASTEKLRALFLPDRTVLERIGRWEKICGLAPRPNDSLDVRRARVVAYLAREEGLSLPAMRTTFAELLDLEADDVQILEFTNDVRDTFDTLDPLRWAVGDAGTWAIDTGQLKVTALAGVDLRFNPAATMNTCHVRSVLGQSGGRFIAAIKLASYWTNLPTNTIAGLFLYNRRSNDAVWFGVRNNSGVRRIGYQILAGNVLGAFVDLAASPDVPLWLRVRPRSTAAFGNASSMSFEYSTVGPSAGFVALDVTTNTFATEWCGAAAMCTDAALGANLDVRFDDFLAFALEGVRPFHWYAYRDPGLPGDPDMVGAHLLAHKVKPAHTYASAVTSKSVLCDDLVDGLCDRGPLGAI